MTLYDVITTVTSNYKYVEDKLNKHMTLHAACLYNKKISYNRDQIIPLMILLKHSSPNHFFTKPLFCYYSRSFDSYGYN